MDLLLTHGYFLYEDPKERAVMRPYPPLGILYLSAYLKDRGFDVAVFDTTFSSRDAFDGFITRERPPVVGIYANLMTRRRVLEQIRACKAAGATVIVGGPEPANYAEEYLRHGADVVVAGEGEQTLEELLLCLARKVSLGDVDGIVFQTGEDTFIRTPPRTHLPNLDALPFPDRDAIDLHAYMDVWRANHGYSSVSLITARGCPYTCSWCSHAVFGHTHRRRSVDNVVREVAGIVERYRPDALWYADDVFTIKPSWLHAYAAALEREGLRVPFETISREDRLNEEIVQRLSEMGCRRLWIGSESGSQRILDAMSRRTRADRVAEMVRLLQRHGIEAGLFLMLGYDGETVADLEETARLLQAAPPDRVLTTLAYPIKGTPYYDLVEDRIIALKGWDDGSDRDFTVAGRHSRPFYGHASRWLINHAASARLRQTPRRDYLRLAGAIARAGAGRVGMYLTRHQVEQPQAAS